jgi:hypothetical protein
LNSNIWIYDIEVFAYDWLIVFHNLQTKDKEIFHNDNYGVAEFIDNQKIPTLGGYNTKHYDQWVLKAIYHGADNATVKELNDFIIAGNDGWNFPFLNYKSALWINFDLMDDIPIPLRLKEIEGNLGMDIEESKISFDLDRPLTDEEYTETVKYCCFDVDAAVKLFEVRKDYLESKIAVGAMCGLSESESLRLTNAKLTAQYLGAKFFDRGDECEYEFPENLNITKYQEVRNFFKSIDPTYKRNLNIDIAGVPHTIAWGGLHGALECYSERKTDTRKVMHIDVTSYYPSLMIVNDYMSRSVPDPDEYRRVYEKRIAAKKSGDKAVADALKLVLNTTYGAMKNKYNALYDPRMANAVCISGQLYLIDLIEKLEDVATFKLIQSNTDGLIVSYDTDHEPEVKSIVSEWEQRTGFKMGMDEIEAIYQKDVNNYVLREVNGSIDVKGGYVSNYEGGDFQNKSLVIVARAIVANLLDGIPTEETINDCDDMEQFQIIAKAGSTYNKVVWMGAAGEIEVQNVNRVYASDNKASGTLYKIKFPKKEGDSERRDKIANLPDHCFIANRKGYLIGMVDKQFYIDMAEKRIKDYLGVVVEKPKKERKKKMATRAKQETPTQEGAQEVMIAGLNAKLMKLREVMNSFSWEKDGINRRQSYEYITEKQYKNNFKAALAAAGLDFKSSMVEYQFIESISDKMNMIIAKFEFKIIDRDSGTEEVYITFGTGADMGDKGLYKAYTGAIKYFLANNYLVAEGSDPESDDVEVKRDAPKYTPPEKREEIKAKVTNQDEPATKEQLEAIALGIGMLEESGVDAEIVSTFTELLTTELTKASAEETIDAIQALIPEDAA